VYRITVTVQDSDGTLAGTASTEVIVYDPSSGFVTGGARSTRQPARCRLTARDGDMNGGTTPDGFRMKMTDSSGAVVYDNKAGTTNDMTAGNTQNIAGGTLRSTASETR